ncbi:MULTISPECIES: guanylate kinase [Methylobacillus]|uniref:Guanylate kinase n=1 Tax=Methylobacillus flagellatus (strain ATCC 51484 / DSM 6875 / VKM B-1610 / KT) TaxID=265072 RepID=KGUA_METFK|nr:MULTISPECIES: guanylate kinase [Methylobacillus]Q1GXB9.1 RecName: Full=Guanylate kinase; AltName: Full=GMP kinase [Methylobacillus flagellatus KT]ABE48319.1 guanylate kinase [Methylobacillus flagellatus KT]MPS47386.1 guanylate kinase [Methylobacillus sp.]
MKGNLFIITAPSGAGKTSLVRALLDGDEHIKLSVSHTTRKPRPGEEDGVHYHFVEEARFVELLNHGDFLESAQVHGAYYGTSQSTVNSALAEGYDLILEIDWQGAQQVRSLYADAISIFILPPSMEALEQRLNNRAQDSAEVIARRLAAAREEMRHVTEFDYVTINDRFEHALEDLRAIIRSQRLRREKQLIRYQDVVQKLL